MEREAEARLEILVRQKFGLYPGISEETLKGLSSSYNF